jgi:uncharacterized RDD family membrane protein YckC/phage FluMu protein Com
MQEIRCPHCGFSREVASANIPPGAVQATCPRCREKFTFQRPEPATAENSSFAFVPEEPPSATVELIPPPAPSPETLPKAGFWVRVAAALIDSLLVSVLQFIFALLLRVATGVDESMLNQPGAIMMTIATALLGAVLAIFYYVFFTGYSGQTPGKMALRLKVIRSDGADIGYGRAFLREVPAKFISGILLGIGYLMVAFDRQKQGLHDKIADTYVIKI